MYEYQFMIDVWYKVRLESCNVVCAQAKVTSANSGRALRATSPLPDLSVPGREVGAFTAKGGFPT